MSDLFAAASPFAPAVFSPCRAWRYRLERRWGNGPLAAFILLNPSTADETNDDPTIRRCIGFAKAWGYSGLVLGNAFALRSTDPAALYVHDDPVGPDNDAALAAIARDAERVVCGWGTNGRHKDRGAAVLTMLRSAGATPMALSLTAGGSPGHPLYLRADAQPFPVPS